MVCGCVSLNLCADKPDNSIERVTDVGKQTDVDGVRITDSDGVSATDTDG